MKQLVLFFCFLLFFLSGCATYDSLRHNSFTMQIPPWEYQEKISFEGTYNGFFATDGSCALNMTFSSQSVLAAAHASFASLHAQDQQATVIPEIFDTSATLVYQLSQPEPLQGKLKILACPSHYTYVVDYSCPQKIFAKRSSDAAYVLDSMTC